MPYLMAMCQKRRCNIEWARPGALANHFKLRHPDALKTEGYWECCGESFLDADKCLMHVWKAHMEWDTPDLPMFTNLYVPRAAVRPTLSSSHPSFSEPANTIRSSSTHDPSFMSTMEPQPFGDASGPASSGTRPPTMLPNNEDGLHISGNYDINWPDKSVPQDLFQSQPYDTVYDSQYSPLFDSDFDLSNFA
jgi:hypothetical protein